ncbi:hypothetical protein HC248_01658 [Polaromonas vacuolata]|uniref:Uncharacterized protein n=2 Tax=Polaromonas vacuolata TaxID=37448 RepID=A0A6H2H978_9BURK|nr:hypothetical protein HC248_01658 [Polaromonas vacuolata]
MRQSPLLQFTSTAFKVESGEDDMTSPDVFGKALAIWLAAELKQRGIQANYPIAEDLGWFIPVNIKPYRLSIACANVDGAIDKWQVLAFLEDWLTGPRFDRDNRVETLQALFEVIEKTLQQAPMLSDLQSLGS